jgi:hypothetical protein
MRTIIYGFAVVLVASPALAQGVRDPSTPNSNMVVPVSPPSQPSRPTATRNIPPQSAAPPLGVRPAYRSGVRPYYRTRR